MSKIDPRLRLLLEEMRDRPELPGAEAGSVPLGERIGWRAGAEGPWIEVLVAGRDLDPAEVVPSEVTTLGTDGEVHAVRISVRDLPALAEHESVERIEASRTMFAELNLSRPECGAEAVHTASPAFTGTGVVVAVLDSGIDYTHPAFRRPDGGTRILALWDQVAATSPGGSVPFGREYTRDEIDRALGSADPLAIVPHQDRSREGHGTHVAGIAAGDERRVPAGRFTGIAPDAELIVVALDTGGESLGTSARLVQALEYVRERTAGRPVVVNLSQGTNVGGHSGESLVERRIDELCREPGFAVVKSAGNEQQWGTHAGGRLAPGEERSLDFRVLAANRLDDVIEVWFGGADDIAVTVVPPSGPVSAAVGVDESTTFVTAAGNVVRIDVDDDADDTGDRRASLILRAGAAGELEPGRWRLVLGGRTITDGRFDAWIERAPRGGSGAPEQSRFVPGVRDPSRTLTIPGTARHVITVASYVTKSQVPGSMGALSSFSSQGPTRDARAKPDLAAPGEFVVSARAGWRADGILHATLAGTSMAAPHVAGAAAIVLQAAPQLTGDQVGQVLRRAARADAVTRAGAPDDWGAGKLDLTDAVALARAARFPSVLGVRVDRGRLRVDTDVATAAVLRLTGGRAPMLDGEPESTTHTFDLAGLGEGPHRCVVEVSAAGWVAVADAGGRSYTVDVEGGSEPAEPESDDLEMISGVGRVVAQRLTAAGISTFAAVAETPVKRLASVAGRPKERVAQEDWRGQARKLLTEQHGPAADRPEGPGARERHPFTVVALTSRRDGRLVAYEVTDGRTQDQEVALSDDALLTFLREKAAMSGNF